MSIEQGKMFADQTINGRLFLIWSWLPPRFISITHFHSQLFGIPDKESFAHVMSGSGTVWNVKNRIK